MDMVNHSANKCNLVALFKNDLHKAVKTECLNVTYHRAFTFVLPKKYYEFRSRSNDTGAACNLHELCELQA